MVNACKFTPAGGLIEVSTGGSADTAFARVRDIGVGIRPELLEALFAPFAQGDDSLARSTGGLGIGLSIARGVAELHGGTLRARSEGPGRGAVFELALPLLPPQTEPARTAMAAEAHAPPRHILIIEDNADIRDSLRLVLDMWGHEVLLASTGDEGLAIAVQARPDVAIIDIGLPGMDGYQLARELHARMRQWPTQVKMIAMTGYGRPSDGARATEAGFHEHILKPVDPAVLRPMLQTRSG